ncbi:calcium-dependent phosphotriesterase [Marasmius fiardii PR-910]|nr:calcium-dependent phosphotriesterase [Marasmius fiardii PR-910]
MLNLRVLAAAFAFAFICVRYVQGQAGPDLTHLLQTIPQAVFVDPHSFAVMGENATFRTDSFDNNTFFNPTSTPPPFFQVFDKSFLSILGEKASIHEIARNDTFAFAHEAPIYNAATDEVFFASNDGGPLGMSDLNHNNVISKISMTAVERALANNESVVNVPISTLDLPESIQMTNGGTGPFKSSLVLITSGRGPRPPSIALVNPLPPNNVTVLLDNYYGRQFNSLNDIKVHPSGKLFFTDVIYGFLNDFRPAPLMPNQVYRFDPDTGAVRVVADGFDKCNGIAFTADGNTVYVADTGAALSNKGTSQTEPATIYGFDVDPRTHAFKNRRVLAYIDAGIGDGIQLDTKGNVYSGTGDGVQVWNPSGDLLGKFFLGTTSANMVFAGDGRLVILAETKVFLAKIAAKGFPLGGH